MSTIVISENPKPLVITENYINFKDSLLHFFLEFTINVDLLYITNNTDTIIGLDFFRSQEEYLNGVIFEEEKMTVIKSQNFSSLEDILTPECRKQTDFILK